MPRIGENPRVDPRVRGGGAASSAARRTAAGRSPRARGRPTVANAAMDAVRSIPACAGEAPAAPRRCRQPAVDPRVRGGGWCSWCPPSGGGGRSPRARGRPRVDAWASTWGRSIPACAGEAGQGQPEGRGQQVDPRVRGGGRNLPLMPASLSGRSPRARGRRVAVIRQSDPDGSIPACAGEAGADLLKYWEARVDPRVRGGGISAMVLPGKAGGRSPRARGRLLGLSP